MIKQALKFIDLDTFLSLMEQRGFGQQALAIIYEGDELPYCSAYLIPTDLLPTDFDLNQCRLFGGIVTKVEEINYVGTETFYSHFMVYPLSMTGFVEVDGISPATFGDQPLEQEPHWKNMVYVINLEDGGGQEFFLTVKGSLINLSTVTEEQPQEFKAYKLVEKKIRQVREKYPATCRLYALERSEFDNRQAILQTPPAADPPPDTQ